MYRNFGALRLLVGYHPACERSCYNTSQKLTLKYAAWPKNITHRKITRCWLKQKSIVVLVVVVVAVVVVIEVVVTWWLVAIHFHC